jgi:hypothetical protein
MYKIATMDTGCQHPLCRGSVPKVLEQEKLCPLHFLRQMEAQCSEIRRETLLGGIDGRRRAEVGEFLSTRAMILAQLATSGTQLRDDTRPFLLSVFLTLINVCERLARVGAEDRSEHSLRMRPKLVAAMPAAGMK